MDLNEAEPARDRRVRRSRAALMRAAVELVSERGTAAVTLSDIAGAADVSRRVVYQHFGDRDTLLLEAGLDLARRELLPRLAETPQEATGREQTLATARHFADHRAFYRALLTGSCAFALDRGLISLLLPINRQAIGKLYGDRLSRQVVDDLAVLLTGGAGSFITSWVVEGDDPLDPEAFTDRLLDVMSVLMTATGRIDAEDVR
ncbi:AcrR family transcriptional regulator [Kibdelosporangium banguiense]|uniref:AcrR family transcriptional regulator n=1 Tax=Kibdelosporangium banguiense TaxID=1365924 RepID=A0ABS4TLV5_9PSEU|nr:TetR family transcriptional regulator [Kibdelosporangium banguiense]MBP2324893.1 AcrR family transcriptional regulator [Kibdelosporangium banguiense]